MDGNTCILHQDDVHIALLIGNVDCVGKGKSLRSVNPATEAVVAEFPGISVSQRIAAAPCARAAFDTGAMRNFEFRTEVQHRFATPIEKNRDRLMDTRISEIGTPINLRPVISTRRLRFRAGSQGPQRVTAPETRTSNQEKVRVAPAHRLPSGLNIIAAEPPPHRYETWTRGPKP